MYYMYADCSCQEVYLEHSWFGSLVAEGRRGYGAAEPGVVRWDEEDRANCTVWVLTSEMFFTK